MFSFINNRSIKKTILLGMVLCMLFMLSGCVSVDTDDALLSMKKVDFEYHKETDITTVHCTLEIQNDTIYTIESFEVNFGVYSKGEKLETEPYSYDHRIKHGETESVSILFTANGEVDEVAFSSWTPNFEPLWKAYINVIVVLGIILLAGIVLWIKEKFFD